MKQGFFITGTDTGVGKTWFTVLLIRYLQVQGVAANGMKPIASGAQLHDGKLANEDALAIHGVCSSSLEYEEVNPFLFEPPVAPHIAADKARRPIDINKIIATYDSLQAKSEYLVVEGVGGWRVPINDAQTLGHLARKMRLPVILVVGLRLGCINHAVLTAEAIRHDGLELLGWVASTLEPDYLYQDETLETLKSALNCPLLAEIPHCKGYSHDQAVLNITSAGHDRLLR